MQSAFGVEHFAKAAYFKVPTVREAKRAATELAKAPKRRVKGGQLKPIERKDYVAPDGVQVRWRGGGSA